MMMKRIFFGGVEDNALRKEVSCMCMNVAWRLPVCAQPLLCVVPSYLGGSHCLITKPVSYIASMRMTSSWVSVAICVPVFRLGFMCVHLTALEY